MKYLVTGGAGFIGSHVVDRLLADGHEVAVVDDLSTGFRENLNPKAAFYEADIRAKNLREIFEKERPQIVNHHAAQMDVTRSVSEPIYDSDVNILGSINLLECCREFGIEKLTYISTGGAVYGEPEYLPVDEAHPIRPKSAYGVSKHAVEHYVELYGDLYGMRWTILRYPNVFGPRQNPNGEAGVNAIFTKKMLEGQTPTIYGGGVMVRDYVYVGDLVEANIISLEKGDGGIYNLGSGVGTTVNEIYTLLQGMIGFKTPANEAPRRPGEVENIYLSARKAKEELGWEPRMSFAEGLEKTVEWFRENLNRWD